MSSPPAVRRGEVGLTEEGTPTIKIYISAEGVEKAYRLYLRDNIELLSLATRGRLC
ncbi:MAG: hypothetical protein QW086_08405 [Pyrobaculum sp.]